MDPGRPEVQRERDVMKNDDAYDNRGYIPDADGFIARWAEDAAAFREAEVASGYARLDRPYGDHPRERLDLFHPHGIAKGLVVFIHGGYWRLFDKSYWSHFAQGALARGWAVAMPSYPLAPEVPIARITRSAAAAVHVASSFVQLPLTLAGHSAGGHLVARMACEGSGLPPDVAARLRAIVPISPVSDLRPLIETSMNADFGLTDATARAESPALLPKALDAPVHVVVGGDERPVFLDQARWLEDAWPGTTREVVPGRHHFDVIDALRDPESDLVARLTP